jgi:uncharacterized protein YutE (UPF0331/DUF86 family)
VVGFRNVVVHDYPRVNLAIVRAIVANHLEEIAAFAEWAVRRYG